MNASTVLRLLQNNNLNLIEIRHSAKNVISLAKREPELSFHSFRDENFDQGHQDLLPLLAGAKYSNLKLIGLLPLLFAEIKIYGSVQSSHDGICLFISGETSVGWSLISEFISCYFLPRAAGLGDFKSFILSVLTVNNYPSEGSQFSAFHLLSK